MTEIVDTGLICGFRFAEDGRAQSLDWNSSQTLADLPAPAWLHFRQSDTRTQAWIAACESIPADWRELLLETDSRIRIEASPKGFAGVLGDLCYEACTEPEHLGVMRFYVDDRMILTTRLHALKTLDQLRIEIRDGLAIHSPVEVVFRFLEDVADTLTVHATQQSEAVDEVEDLVLKDRSLRESEALGRVRRFLTRLRRQVDAQRHALNQLTHRPPHWFCEPEMAELRRLLERLNAVYLDLESVQERARLLQDEIAGRVANATNRNLYVVSLLTAVFLPITLISGIFGMNVGGLPWENQTGGFGLVMTVMGLTILTSLALMHWRRFF